MKYYLLKTVVLMSCLFITTVLTEGQIVGSNPQLNENFTLCEVKANPEAFIDKPINVKAVYVVGFETGWLEPTAPCADSGLNRIRVSYRFDEGFDDNSNAKARRRMNRIIRKKNTSSRRISGLYTIRISKHQKLNESENLFDYDITFLKILSVVKIKNQS